jgi:hypothetical protein
MDVVTIKAEDFKTIHNALCELRSVYQLLHDVVREPISDKLNAAIRSMEAGLADAYQQDNAQFDSKMDYYHRFQTENGLKTIWSIFELPIHGFLADHPFKDAKEICYRDHWGEDPIYETIQGATWADLYRAADRCIQRSGDQHHCFIEGFYPVANQPHQLRLTTGS